MRHGLSGDKRPSGHFSACVAGTRYETLPPEAIDAAKKSILDTLGVILAASGLEPAAHGVIDIVRAFGGRGRSHGVDGQWRLGALPGL